MTPAARGEELWQLPHPVAIAHRGGVSAPPAGAAAGSAPGGENSLAAFAAAARMGFRYVETDVRASDDGVAVLAHDGDLRRLAGRPEAVADLPWAELAGTVDRLDEALAAFPTLTFNLDVKDARAVAPLVEAVLDAGATDRVCVASFAQARRRQTLRAFAKAGRVPASSAGRGGVARFLAGARAGVRGDPLRRLAGAWTLQVPELSGTVRVVDARTVRAAHEAGMRVHVWTVNAREDMERLLDLGVDGLISDRLDVLREVLAGRGDWAGPAPSRVG